MATVEDEAERVVEGLELLASRVAEHSVRDGERELPGKQPGTQHDDRLKKMENDRQRCAAKLENQLSPPDREDPEGTPESP